MALALSGCASNASNTGNDVRVMSDCNDINVCVEFTMQKDINTTDAGISDKVAIFVGTMIVTNPNAKEASGSMSFGYPLPSDATLGVIGDQFGIRDNNQIVFTVLANETIEAKVYIVEK
jgi:hypothetical protein